MACAGLIWMQIALKEDLDSLKEKLRTSKIRSPHTDSFHVTSWKAGCPFDTYMLSPIYAAMQYNALNTITDMMLYCCHSGIQPEGVIKWNTKTKWGP